MTENFDSYNAPQFFDFSKGLHCEDNIDEYFEVDHESIKREDPSEDPLQCGYSEENLEEQCEFFSPMQATPGNNGYESNVREEFRRSMSVGDLYHVSTSESYAADEEVKSVSKAIAGLGVSESEKQSRKKPATNLKKASSNLSLNKDKAGPTRTSAPRLTRGSSKEYLNKLAQPKRTYSSAQNLDQCDYVSMAEAVKKFQNTTPTRFRSKPKDGSNCALNKLKPTIPQSPALMTKGRHRPLTALTREEQEIREYEEAQKFKIRAHPLNKKILQGPLKPMVSVEKKPTTIVEPFKITAAPRKVAQSPKKEVFEFHAQPVPKAIHEPPRLKDMHKFNPTIAQTPTFMKRCVKEPIRPQENLEGNKQMLKLAKTIPVPFSFEKRDQFMQKRKEEFIQKVIEEEKKAREFHARPVPKVILKTAKHGSLHRSSSSNSMAAKGLTKSDECLSTQFKARPPTVLYKKPFEPKLDEHHLIEISEFQLNTEMRVREREEFEQFKREKEERIALEKQMEEERMLQLEEEERARIRKGAEYKAQPIKKYKDLKIQPSGKYTEPISPKFHTDKYRSKANKENFN